MSARYYRKNQRKAKKRGLWKVSKSFWQEKEEKWQYDIEDTKTSLKKVL